MQGDLGAFRCRLADAAKLSDAEIGELLSTGYAHVLELESQQAALARRIDALLDAGHDDAVVEAVRLQRGLRVAIGALREELESLAAMRRAHRPDRPRHGDP